MTESLRPPESSSIGEGLRIRLEGDVEVLEAALPLLDSLTALLGRDGEVTADEVETLHACVNQLPRITEAIDRAHRHEQATGLTQAVGQYAERAHREARARLLRLGRDEQPSLRGSVTELLHMVQRQGQAPRVGETLLLQSGGAPWVLALAAGVLLVAGTAVLGTTLSILMGALGTIIALHGLTPRPWVLLPDRLYFPARRGRLAWQIAPAQLQGLKLVIDRVEAQVSGEHVELQTGNPGALLTVLQLLRGSWLSGLLPRPRQSVVLDAVGDVPEEPGRALITADGVLFVPHSRAGIAARVLAGEPLQKDPALDELLALLAHVPEEKWNALGEHLSLREAAVWLRRGEVIVERSANAHEGVTLRSGAGYLRLLFPKSTGDDLEARAEVLFARLRRGAS